MSYSRNLFRLLLKKSEPTCTCHSKVHIGSACAAHAGGSGIQGAVIHGYFLRISFQHISTHLQNPVKLSFVSCAPDSDILPAISGLSFYPPWDAYMITNYVGILHPRTVQIHFLTGQFCPVQWNIHSSLSAICTHRTVEQKKRPSGSCFQMIVYSL